MKFDSSTLLLDRLLEDRRWLLFGGCGRLTSWDLPSR